MNTNNIKKQTFRKFGFLDKFSYMMGDLGCCLSFSLNASLMLFYTQYMGLSLTTWGVIILILKVWDAINDPIMGALIDSRKPGKRGKFKTYIFYGSFMLIFSSILVFLPIPSAAYWAKVALCIVGYLLWDMSYTVVNVPYGAMNVAITSDPTERAQLSTWRSIGSKIASLVVAIVLPIFTYEAGTNNYLGGRIVYISLVLGVISFIAFQILLKGTVERVEMPVRKDNEPKFNYLESMKAFFHNRAMVALTIATVAQLIMLLSASTVSQLVFQIYFQNGRLAGVLGIMMIIPSLMVAPFIKPLVKKFGKKEAATFPLLLGIVLGVVMAFAPIPRSGTGIIIWLALTFFINVSTAFFGMVTWAMVADCIDYQEIQTGRREDGTVYATYSLFRKIAQGIGSSIVAFLLILTGYNELLGPQQTAEVANNIRMLCGIIEIVGISVMFLVMLFIFKIDKKASYEIQEKLGRITK